MFCHYFCNPVATVSVYSSPKNSPFGVFPSDKNKILQISTLEKLLNQCSAFLCFIAIECSANNSTSSVRKHMVWSKRPLTTVPVSDIGMFTGKKSIQSSTRQICAYGSISHYVRGIRTAYPVVALCSVCVQPHVSVLFSFKQIVCPQCNPPLNTHSHALA